MARSMAVNLALLLAYFLMLAVVVAALVSSRRWALRVLGSPEARQQWQAWRDEEIRRARQQEGPVRRRPPKAEEPPLLILLRDSFGGILLGVLVIASVLFGFVVYVVRSACGGESRSRSDRSNALPDNPS